MSTTPETDRLVNWRPLKDADEAQLWEFVHDSLGPEIRNVSFLGEPARALRKFITENAEVSRGDGSATPTTEKS